MTDRSPPVCRVAPGPDHATRTAEDQLVLLAPHPLDADATVEDVRLTLGDDQPLPVPEGEPAPALLWSRALTRLSAADLDVEGDSATEKGGAYRIRLAKGVRVEAVLPPMPLGAELRLVGVPRRMPGTVRIAVLWDGGLVEEITTDGPGTVLLPASERPTRLSLVCQADMRPAEAPFALLGLELRSGHADRCVVRSAPVVLDALEAACGQGALVLAYPPVVRVLWNLDLDAEGTAEEDGRRRHRIWTRAGEVRASARGQAVEDLRWNGQPIAWTVEGDRRRALLTATDTGLQVLEWPADGGPRGPVRLLVTAHLGHSEKARPALLGRSSSAARRLMRVEHQRDRRLAHVLLPGQAGEATLAAGPATQLRFAWSSWAEPGPTGAPPAGLEVLLRDEDGAEHLLWSAPPGPATGRWQDVAVPLPALASDATLRVRGLGEPYALTADDRVVESFLGFALPRRERTGERPGGVVLVTVDTLRADHLGLYGYARDTTPGLDAMADELVVFDEARSVASWTRPSTASLLTGLHPAFHGAHRDQALAPDVQTLAEHFRGAGFTTAALVLNPQVSAAPLGFARGFDQFVTGWRDADPQQSVEFLPWIDEWLDQHAGERFFLYVHVIDPHTPYDPPEEDWRRFDPETEGEAPPTDARTLELMQEGRLDEVDLDHLRARYDGCIRVSDRFVTGLRERLVARGLDRPTSLWITADHGEEFLEHGSLGHGQRLFQEQVRVPLVVKPAAGLPWPAGRRAAPVQLVDVAPTLLAAAGLDAAALPTTGRDLGPILRGLATAEDGQRPLFFEEQGAGLRGVSLGPWKWIGSSDGEGRNLLFDLSTDPGEHQDQAGADPDRLQALRARFDAWRTAQEARGLEPARPGAPPELREAVLERLRELGYVD